MEELVRLVSQKAGISTDQARIAVQTVAGFIKQRVPAPFAGMVDDFINKGSMPSGNGMKDLGNLFGRK